MPVIRERLPVAGVLVVLWLFYLGMFLHYRPYDIDNPWFLSFSLHAFGSGPRTDQFLDIRFPYGMDGTVLFGRIAAALQTLVLRPFGWQQWPAEILTASLVAIALAFWAALLRRLGFQRHLTFFFLLVAGLCEPVLSAANRFRYESVSLLLISGGLLLIASRRTALGVLFAALSVEVEPAAATGLLAALLLAWFLHRSIREVLLRGGLACAVAGLAYLALHPAALHPSALFAGQVAGPLGTPARLLTSSSIDAFFLQRVRHLPELLFFLVMAWMYWRKRRVMSGHYFAVAAAATSISLLFMPHANVAYLVFAYPFLIVMAGQVLLVNGQLRRGMLILPLYFLVQYAVTAYHNRESGYRAADIQSVSRAINDARRSSGLDKEELRVYGDYSLWFAHPEHYRAAAVSTLDQVRKANLFLCFDKPIEPPGLQPSGTLHCSEMLGLLPLTLKGVLPVRGHTLKIYVRAQH